MPGLCGRRLLEQLDDLRGAALLDAHDAELAEVHHDGVGLLARVAPEVHGDLREALGLVELAAQLREARDARAGVPAQDGLAELRGQADEIRARLRRPGRSDPTRRRRGACGPAPRSGPADRPGASARSVISSAVRRRVASVSADHTAWKWSRRT